ncbi:MAG: hypothetical protein M1825_003886 [Sarcosagium campestre]|nr:MAG: hypothetical protein M1825_003886 [Sarcosagium campestre]
MLVGICGGICAGKHSVAQYLIQEHGFKQIFLSKTASPPCIAEFEDGKTVPRDKLTVVEGEKRPSFPNVESLLDFVTKKWQERWLTTDIWDETVLDSLQRRPFFLLVSVDAPVSLRWRRFTERCRTASRPGPTLEEFVLRNDAHLYDHTSGLAVLIDRAQVRLINSTCSKARLEESLEALDLTDEQRLRPSWDQYFMQLASLAAQRSNCMKRRVGCVLVREKRVISTGYNGTPRGIKNCNEGGCVRCNDAHSSGVGLATCLCIHAEENALLEAGRERIRENSILYCDTIKITQVGISEVVYSQGYSMDDQTAAVFKEGGVHLRQFTPPRKGLVNLGAVDRV